MRTITHIVLCTLLMASKALSGQSKSQHYQFEWGVIGAGPAGIAAVATLLDQAVPASQIVWFDPTFTVGSLSHFQMVISNSPIKNYLAFFQTSSTLRRMRHINLQPLKKIRRDKSCQLKLITKPLQEATEVLREKVCSLVTTVTDLTYSSTKDSWLCKVDNNTIAVRKIITATGAHPKELTHPQNLKRIPLETALNSKLLAKVIEANKPVAVFGSSHSAMNALENLVKLGVTRIIHVCKVIGLRFRSNTEHGMERPYSGLKGHAAQWAQKNLVANQHPSITHVLTSDPALEEILANCNQVIDAVGFESNGWPTLHDAPPGRGPFEPAQNIFLLGFVAPPRVLDAFGREEDAVGILEFLQQAQRSIPTWRNADHVRALKRALA